MHAANEVSIKHLNLAPRKIFKFDMLVYKILSIRLTKAQLIRVDIEIWQFVEPAQILVKSFDSLKKVITDFSFTKYEFCVINILVSSGTVVVLGASYHLFENNLETKVGLIFTVQCIKYIKGFNLIGFWYEY